MWCNGLINKQQGLEMLCIAGSFKSFVIDVILVTQKLADGVKYLIRYKGGWITFMINRSSARVILH